MLAVFSGWKLCSLPPDVWNVKPLSAAPRRSFQEHADSRPGHNAELLARDPWAKIWGNPFAAKATPSPYKLPYLPRPAHFWTCSHLSTEIWDLVRPTSPNCSRQEVNIYLNYSMGKFVHGCQEFTNENNGSKTAIITGIIITIGLIIWIIYTKGEQGSWRTCMLYAHEDAYVWAVFYQTDTIWTNYARAERIC